MDNKITLAIADDELLFRQGLISILAKEDNLDIVFDAENGKDLMNKLRSSDRIPQIIITDLKMPELNGVEATKLIRKEFPDIKIIALTSYFSKPFIINMISIGAVAYLAKNSTPKLMLTTIREVAEKGFYYDEKVIKFIHDGLINNKDQVKKSNFDNTYFTKREREVLDLICAQYTTNEIAEQLFISPRTVDGHRNNLLLKTEAKNLAGLVVYAIQHKLVNLEEKF
ncbi:response regulator transcription factor [Psychroserpens sp.]|uniref:response regulator transcription factor n=1 Tax=Psychroserpens sp. TaxID=2020870 RepID=UPI001B01B793|nr:response regulator transcription factor [Psychroserpens sp.]MBO6605636.1 response regulator transcription factor [Psychroserpens sp.]MBO6631824.1 response regulator transcription factor [Psychroserpens sp.]MBO6653555.1 response regulator transcription factor [Psychroserpens sp.]MBO6681876.1 response regulator transcription factor [Psychroserpens sp.]MBO6749010.1 response regulator transcription factor [Psychroserpens sp.]